MNSSGSLKGDKELKSTLAKFALKHYHTALVAKGIVTYDDLEAKCVACVGDEPKEDADDVITDMVVSHTHVHAGILVLPHLDSTSRPMLDLSDTSRACGRPHKGLWG